MKLPAALFLCLLVYGVNAQKYTISGYVREAESGENLIGATIYNPINKSGTLTNNHGHYSITLAADSVKLSYSYVGFQPQTVAFILTRDTVINASLNVRTLDEVVVKATRVTPDFESTRMSTMTISQQMIKAVPALLGEVDVLKVLQLMPGVQSGSEGSSGLYVRGGGPDQNLTLLDGVPVYNASHLFGFFSVFNAYAVNHVELIKGGFPARYGGRLSSVIDINMKEGNMKKLKGEISVGIIASKGTIEGPIKKDRTSFIVSARRTYIDLLILPFLREHEKAGYYFYDLNFKINHIVNAKNRIFWSNYSGNDKMYLGTNSTSEYLHLQWNNIISSFRWNHVFTPKLFSNLNFTYSRYQFDIFARHSYTKASSGEESSFRGKYLSGIRDWAVRLDFDFLPNPAHYIRYGIHNIFHRFTPGAQHIVSTEMEENFSGGKITDAIESSVYVEDDWSISRRIKVNAGLHGAAFFVDHKKYLSLQPRLSMRYLITETMSAKASYATMTQFIHLLANSGIGLPTDLWVPSTSRVAPQQSDQIAVGLSKLYKEQYEISLEGYYKKMHNLIGYLEGANFTDASKDWQDNIALGGQGKSYGLEVLLQKKEGRLKGWVGYTLSKTTRQFELLNFGKEYPYKYDRRHDASFTASYEISPNVEAGMTFVYGTGNAMTLPNSTYELSSYLPGRIKPSYRTNALSGNEYINYDSRNSYRMRPCHRMDLSLSFSKDKKHGRRKWTLAVYNAYSRNNPFFIYRKNRDGKDEFLQVSMFPILPSFSYSFQFK